MKTKKKGIISLIILCFICVSAFMISFSTTTKINKDKEKTTDTKQNTIKQDNLEEVEIADLSPYTYNQKEYGDAKDETLYGGETVKYYMSGSIYSLKCYVTKGSATVVSSSGTSCSIKVGDAQADGTVKIKLAKIANGKESSSKTITLKVLKNVIYKETAENSITLNFKSDWDSNITQFHNWWPSISEPKDCSSYNSLGSTGDSYRKFNLVRKESSKCIGLTTYVTIDAKRWGKSHKLQYRIKILPSIKKATFSNTDKNKGTIGFTGPSDCEVYDKTTCDVKFPEASPETGYTFKGWYSSASCTGSAAYTSAGNHPISSDKTYYACWTASKGYIITFKNSDTSKGTISKTSASCEINSSGLCNVSFPTVTPNSGYKFSGWYTSSDCSGTKATSLTGGSFSVQNDKTYYACWSGDGSEPENGGQNIEPPKTTTTTYNKDFYIKNGGSVVTGSLIFSCGDKVHITTCTENGSTKICNVTKINDVALSSTVTVNYSDLVETFDKAGCTLPIKRYVTASKTAHIYTDSEATQGKKVIACGSEVDFYNNVSESCKYKDNTVCKAKYGNDDIYIERNFLTPNKPTSCPKETTTPEEPTTEEYTSKQTSSACENVKKLTDQTGKNIKVKVCYKNENGKLVDQYDKEELLKCKDGYNKVQMPEVENNCTAAAEGEICYQIYTYNCNKIAKPRVEATGSSIDAKGLGIVNIKGISETEEIYGYFISTTKSVSASSDWKLFTKYDDVNRIGYATESLSANTYFVWVKDKNDILSRPVLVQVYDADLTTTLKDVEIKDESGNKKYKPIPIKVESEVAYGNMNKDAKYVRLSNTLAEESEIADFQPLSTAYELTVDSPTITLYATLTSSDASYVEGYEPRTVNLEYGENTVLIKIKNNKGKERTYTFIITRKDTRENNNLLSSVSLSKGKINFDSYNSDYTVVVPKNTKTVSINGTLASSKSSFVEGYEPRTVNLDNDVTSAVIKTVSESGSVRSYVFTFEKRGENEKNEVKNSVYLSSLSIPGTELSFDKETTSYQVSVEYEVDYLRLYALPESENASVEISNTNGLKVGPNLIQVTVKNNGKQKIYTIYVNRKEDGLNVSGDTNLGSLTIKDYPIEFNKEVLDYTVKIKREKTLMIAATPESNRSEVYMYGNNDLTRFSTVRVKVIAENGETKVYSIDIQKDSYNKVLELTAGIIGGVIIIGAAIIIVVSKKKKKMKEYIEG